MLTQPELKERPEITGQLRAVRSPHTGKKVQFKIQGHHQKHPFTASCVLHIQSSVHGLPCSCSFHPYNNREVLLKAHKQGLKKETKMNTHYWSCCHSQHLPTCCQPREHGAPFNSVRTPHQIVPVHWTFTSPSKAWDFRFTTASCCQWVV